MTPLLEIVKTVLGVVDDEFDMELLMYINTATSALLGFGVMELDGIFFHTSTPMPDIGNIQLKSLCRGYIAATVRLVFDPPANESVATAYRNLKDEAEMRIQLIVNESEVEV